MYDPVDSLLNPWGRTHSIKPVDIRLGICPLYSTGFHVNYPLPIMVLNRISSRDLDTYL